MYSILIGAVRVNHNKIHDHASRCANQYSHKDTHADIPYFLAVGLGLVLEGLHILHEHQLPISAFLNSL